MRFTFSDSSNGNDTFHTKPKHQIFIENKYFLIYLLIALIVIMLIGLLITFINKLNRDRRIRIIKFNEHIYRYRQSRSFTSLPDKHTDPFQFYQFSIEHNLER